VKAAFLALFSVLSLFGWEYYGLLKRMPSPAVPVFYTPEFGGEFECYLFGTATTDLVKKELVDECNISKTDKKLMDYYSGGFYQNTLYLEQKYKYRFFEGFCFMHNGASIYNYQLAKEGYGLFMMPESVNTQEAKEILDRIKFLVLEARRERRGLWREWRDEMECLQGKIYDIFKDE